MEHIIKMDDLGVPLFSETPTFWEGGILFLELSRDVEKPIVSRAKSDHMKINLQWLWLLACIPKHDIKKH